MKSIQRPQESLVLLIFVMTHVLLIFVMTLAVVVIVIVVVVIVIYVANQDQEIIIFLNIIIVLNIISNHRLIKKIKKRRKKNNSVKNSKNPQQSEIKEENNENENKNEQPKEEPKENNQNPNIKDNENFEQKQFNEFLKKLINVESQIEEAKVNLANNPDFNCEDAFRLFETNEKGYLDKEDIKKGLNLIGITPTEQELNILMKRFDLQKNNFINYADFFDMVVPFDKDLRPAVENRQPKSPDNFSEKTINDLKNLFELIIKTEMDINNERKNFGTLRLKLKDIFALIDKSGKGFFDIDEMMVYLANNNIVESNKNADLLFIRLDKNRNAKIDFPLIEDELQILY